MMRRVMTERKGHALELSSVSASYAQGTHSKSAMDDVSLVVDHGELVALLGPNGAGKSTLIRVLAGTLSATKGTVRAFGAPLAEMDRSAIARSIAVVPQHDEVAFGYSVREVVAMGRAPHQRGWMWLASADEKQVREAIARCDLESLLERPVDQLSGGERKRVAIARALAQTPKVLLLDEPGAFLDVKHQLALYDLLVDLVAKESLAVVVSMHDLNAAAQWASRVALMKEGKLVAVGSVAEVMTYRRLKETFDAELYCGENELNGKRFFLPMRRTAEKEAPKEPA
ncbi:ABC transporter ATP-binding protein [soil metagenome]